MKFSVQEIAHRADTLYAAREDVENVNLSARLLSDALSEEFDYELAWRLGRARFFLGQEERDKARARALHAGAVKICRRAAIIQPSRVEAHFWLGVNLALSAAGERSLFALGRALAARRSLRRAVTLDPAYHAAGPLRVLARLEARLPAWLGGGHARARSNFEKAIAIAPANSVTRLYFAELLLQTGDEQGARRELQAILDAPPDPAWAFEAARDSRLAQTILDKTSPKSKV